MVVGKSIEASSGLVLDPGIFSRFSKIHIVASSPSRLSHSSLRLVMRQNMYNTVVWASVQHFSYSFEQLQDLQVGLLGVKWILPKIWTWPIVLLFRPRKKRITLQTQLSIAFRTERRGHNPVCQKKMKAAGTAWRGCDDIKWWTKSSIGLEDFGRMVTLETIRTPVMAFSTRLLGQITHHARTWLWTVSNVDQSRMPKAWDIVHSYHSISQSAVPRKDVETRGGVKECISR